jgi:hypothetical protein
MACVARGGQFVLFALLLVSASCKFPELPDIEDDASVDAAGTDVAVGPAAVTTSQGAHDFGEIVIGEVSPLLQVTIDNTGGEATGPLSVTLLGVDPGQFEIVPTGDSTDCVNARVNGGDSCVAQVRYAPGANTTATARLEVSGNPGGTAVVPLTGDAITPADLSTTTTGHDFGDLVMGQPSTLLTVVIRNEGEQTSGSLSVTLDGAHPGDFTIVPTGMANDCESATLELQDTCIAQVRFQATVAATRTANLVVAGTPGGTVTVPLTGDGLSPGNLMVEMPTGGAALDFGTRELATGATSTTQTIRIRNTGGAATGTLDVTLTGGGASSFTTPIENCDNAPLGANATCDVQVRFNPTAVGSQPATVTVRDTVANTAASVSITGTGSARAVLAKTGQGMVVSTPTGINCGTGCASQTHSFTQTPVSLEATAESGWAFSGWTGSCETFSSSAICSLTLDQGIENVGAAFTQVFVLMVSTTGSGTVTTPSTGILCGNGNTDCDETYAVNTMVTLNAEPDAGWEVFSWMGTGTTCNAGARTCMVSMNQARNVSVVFRRRFTLTVGKSDTGDGSAGYGSIASTNVGGITCGADCMEVFFDGQSVTLDATATPTAAATLAASPWTLPSGFTCATNPCTITVTQSLTATANYQIRQYDLTVTRTGNGAALGTIMRNPTGTSCGTDCTRYPYDTNVMIDASAATGASFTGWTGGGCPATGTCPLDMTTNRTVSAGFTLAQYTLTVTKAGFGSGTVTGTIPPSTQVINCGTGSGCMASINHGTMVTLTATPTAGDIFYGWSGGGCSGTDPCTTTVTAATMVTATFDNCVRSTQSCTSGNFMQCTSSGDFVSHVVPNGANGSPATITYDGTYACPMGCHATQPRCNDVSAVNGLNTALDAAATSSTGYDLLLDDTSGDIIIDTSTYNAGSGTITISEPGGQQHVVPATLISQANGRSILTLQLRTLTVGAGARVKVRGVHAFGVASHFDIYIAGHLDLSGASGGAGPAVTGACYGSAGTATGGGGNQNSGGTSSTGASGGLFLGNFSPNLQPLEGGCAAGSANNGTLLGARGGGSVQLVTRTKLSIATSGIVNVSGARGFGHFDFNSNGSFAVGGGSGGGILIEAPAVSVDPSGRLAGRGGSGGAARVGTSTVGVGNHGDWDLNASTVPGATCTNCGTGGSGGLEATLPGNGMGTSPAIAGGGGAGGRCHIKSRSGVYAPPSTSAKITVTSSALGSR